MHTKIGKMIACGAAVILLAILLVSFSSVSNREKTDVDWEVVNSALNENGYRTDSLEEAEVISGYSIPRIKQLPSGFELGGILISKVNPFEQNPALEVWLTWGHNEEKSDAGSFNLFIKISKPAENKYDESDIFEVEGKNVYSTIEGEIYSLDWYKGGINYFLYGDLTDTLTKETYHNIVESIITGK